MARVNAAPKIRPSSLTHEGTPAKSLSVEQEFRRTALACLLWEDSFYEDGKAVADRLATFVTKASPDFVAALAIEARGAMKLRHLPLYLCVQLARRKALKADTLAAVIQRADELAEFVALYWKDGKVPLAAQVKKGLAKAFQKFNAYSLAKYNQDADIKLRDVLFLCHATPKDAEQAATWKQLVDGTLPIPDTWEVALSAGKDKKATWTRLIQDGQLGALAVLRNLRNMQEAKVEDAVIRQALTTMQVERVLPFRFISAQQYAPRFESELEGAMFRCLADAKKLAGRTALVVDTSPSMWQDRISAKSEMSRFGAAAALAMLCREICESVSIYAFNQRTYDVPARRGFALGEALAATQGNYSCGGLAVALANQHGYDRIIVITDGQWHYPTQGGWTEGTATSVSPAPLTEKAYMVNVATHRNGVGYGKWRQIDGWSEAIVDYIAACEMPASIG